MYWRILLLLIEPVGIEALYWLRRDMIKFVKQISRYPRAFSESRTEKRVRASWRDTIADTHFYLSDR